MRTAERDETTVRAVGSGHAWSDVALTTGYLVRTDRLSRPLEVDHLRSDWDGPRLERAEAGMRLRELNQVLARKGLALQQMGGYDAQTIAGVISTSTHGSGIGLGPLPDFIHSLDIVAAGGRLHRIERAGGPTDAAAFTRARPDVELHQDDHWFDAAVVGMGCMGVVYSAAIEVTDAYWLKEVRELRDWSFVSEELRARRVLDANRHYEIYINPYTREGNDHRCIVCTRNPTDAKRRRAWDRLRRHWWIELASRLKITPILANLALDIKPESSPAPDRPAARLAARQRVQRAVVQGAQHRRREPAAGLLVGDRGAARGRQPPAGGRRAVRGRRQASPPRVRLPQRVRSPCGSCTAHRPTCR